MHGGAELVGLHEAIFNDQDAARRRLALLDADPALAFPDFDALGLAVLRQNLARVGKSRRIISELTAFEGQASTVCMVWVEYE